MQQTNKLATSSFNNIDLVVIAFIKELISFTKNAVAE